MLVAAPGQTATYTALHASASKKSCHTTTTTASMTNTNSSSSSATPKQNSNNNNSVNNTLNATNKLNNNKNKTQISSNDIKSISTNLSTGTNSNSNSTSSSSTALLKTLSVRLNRGTEFLKGTVQKALLSNVNNLTSNNSTTNTNTNNTNSIVNNSLKAATSTVNTTKLEQTNNLVTTKLTNQIGSTTATSTLRSLLPTNSLQKLYTVPPTALHRSVEARKNTSSVDSLCKEMCHFKPIRTVPTTPMKIGSKSRGFSIKVPKANRPTIINLNPNCDEHDNDENKKEKQNFLADKETYSVYQPKPCPPNAIKTILTSPSHKSAFVCLSAKMKQQHYLQQTDNQLPVRKRRNPRITETTNPLTPQPMIKSKQSKHTETTTVKTRMPNIKTTTKANTNYLKTVKNRQLQKLTTVKSATTTTMKDGSRKRKIAKEELNKGEQNQHNYDNYEVSVLNKNTKNLKLPKDCSEKRGKITNSSINTKKTKKPTTITSLSSLSPPMTRARLKQAPELKLNEAIDYTTQRGKIF